MGRATTILARFPAHFEAARPGTLLGRVVEALARDLDVQAAQLGDIRRAHRLREAFATADLMALAALHGIGEREVEALSLRLARTAALADTLAAAPPADRPAALRALLSLWPLDLPPDPEGGPPADLLAPLRRPGEADDATLARLLAAVAAGTAQDARRAALSTRIARICATSAQGNGTVRALLEAAATALDLDILATAHSVDRYLHAATVRDRLALAPEGGPVPPARTEVLGLEENPLRRAEIAPAERRHGEAFDILRKGFDPARLEIAIAGREDRTVAPMVVNRDEGRGVAFAGLVPPGATLVLSETGRATMAGADVTAFAFGFAGAVFADAAAPAPADARFDAAPFVVTDPPGALDAGAAFPHDGRSLAMPTIAVGRTRMAVFVQEGHFGTEPPPAPPLPGNAAGTFAGEAAPGAVFAPGPGEARSPAALLGFAWREREAYKVRITLPPRIRAFSPTDEGAEIARLVSAALERVRPAGVAIETTFAEDRWLLGEGTLPGAGPGSEALAALAGGTRLWPAPTDP